ncbi:hypothetical protein U1Q18_034874 [Sarracenia purpurea var. burkii]
MLLSPSHQHHLSIHVSPHLHSRRNPNSTTVLHLSTAARRCHILTICSYSQNSLLLHDDDDETPQNLENSVTSTAYEHEIFRKHNAKSTALLLRHLPKPDQPSPEIHHLKSEDLHSMSVEDKIKLLEMSLVRKRTPQFPGSIYIQSSSDVDVNSSLPPLQRLFDGRGGGDDEEILLRAVEIRRSVTVEIFKEAMRRGKFGITYYTNLVSRLPEFIDYVMIKAASMKQLPEFSKSTFNVRAKTFIDDCNVVPLIRWLKHNSLSYPQIAKLICIARGNLGAIRNVAEWLKSIHVNGRFIGVVLTKAGDNILERSTEELDEIVGYLEINGVRSDWMGCVIGRCPQLLSYSMEELKYRVQFYLDMGMNDGDFGTMIFDYPKVLGYFSIEEMKQKVGYLQEFGLSNEDVGRLLAFKPQLMGCSIEERWKPLIKYLYYLGISKDGMRRILTIKPMVFCVDLERTIVPKGFFDWPWSPWSLI